MKKIHSSPPVDIQKLSQFKKKKHVHWKIDDNKDHPSLELQLSSQTP